VAGTIEEWASDERIAPTSDSECARNNLCK
jgi:hypothetical protein